MYKRNFLKDVKKKMLKKQNKTESNKKHLNAVNSIRENSRSFSSQEVLVT